MKQPRRHSIVVVLDHGAEYSAAVLPASVNMFEIIDFARDVLHSTPRARAVKIVRLSASGRTKYLMDTITA